MFRLTNKGLPQYWLQMFCNLNTLLLGYFVVNLIWNLMKDLFWFTVAFLSGNQFRNLFCKITAGFMGYRAAYPLRTSCMSPYSWHIMALLYRIIPIFFLWNILAHHLGNALTYLTRFNPTFSLWTCLQSWLDSSQPFPCEPVYRAD